MTEHSSKGRPNGPEGARTPGGRRTGHGAETALEELQRRMPGRPGAAPPLQADSSKRKTRRGGSGSA